MYTRPEMERANRMLQPAVQYIKSVKQLLSDSDYGEFLILCREYITQTYVFIFVLLPLLSFRFVCVLCWKKEHCSIFFVSLSRSLAAIFCDIFLYFFCVLSFLCICLLFVSLLFTFDDFEGFNTSVLQLKKKVKKKFLTFWQACVCVILEQNLSRGGGLIWLIWLICCVCIALIANDIFSVYARVCECVCV